MSLAINHLAMGISLWPNGQARMAINREAGGQARRGPLRLATEM